MTNKYKLKIWDNPNKMHCASGHKGFDQQTVCLGHGHMMTPTQYSGGVRAYNTLKNPINQPCKAGEMQEFDLNNSFFDVMPKYVRKFIRENAVDQDVHVYQFHSRGKNRFVNYNGRVKRSTLVIHGYVITTSNGDFLRQFVTGPTHKSYDVINYAKQYVVRLPDELPKAA